MPTPRIPFPTTPSEYLVAPTGGWSPDVPMWEMPTDAAPLLENFQIKPGKIRVRPPYRTTADLSSINVSLAGWVPYLHGTSLLTRRLFTSALKVEPQNIHRVGVNVPASTVQVEDAMYEITGSTVTRHAITTGLAPSFREVDFNGLKYAITYNSPGAGTMTYNDGLTGWQHVLVNLNSSAAAVVSGAPVGSFDVYGWLNRIWMLGGLPGTGGPAASTTSLFFTNPLQVLSLTAADWEDPVTGLYNQIDIDGDHKDPGVALASLPAGLILLRQNSVFILRGTDPTSYTIRPVSKQAGCLDARSVVEMNSKVYFMSSQGFMVTDGTQVQNVSGPLQDELYRQIAMWNNAVFNSTGAWCTADQMSDGKILVSFGSYNTGDPTFNYSMIGALSAVFDPSTGAWVKVSTQIGPVGPSNSLGPSIQGYGELSTLGGSRAVKIEDNVNGVTSASASALHDVSSVAGAFVPITATWTARSPQANLGSRGKIHSKRVFMDYAVSTGGVPGTVAYQLTDRIGSFTLAAYSVAASTNASDPRQYLQRDEDHEVADLGITVTVSGTNATGALSVPKAEIHGVGVEFSASSEMRPIV